MTVDGFDPMAAADVARDFAAAMTGMKKQLTDAGWTEANAEALVVEMYRKIPE